MDGLEFCRLVKSNPRTKDIPFMFITVLNSPEEQEQAFLAGAVLNAFPGIVLQIVLVPILVITLEKIVNKIA